MATYRPSLEEVLEFAASGNTIPVFRELPATWRRRFRSI